jgi:protein-disulfide isomerase
MHRKALLYLHKPLVAVLILNASWVLAEDLTSNATVAMIGNQAIPYSQLQALIQDKLDKQREQLAAQLQQLNLSYLRDRQAYTESELGKLIDEQVLLLESASRKTTPAALRSAIKPPTVTDAQVRSFYESQKPPITQPFAQIEPPIRQFLEDRAVEQSSRKYFDSLRAKYKASVTMEPLREQVEESGPQRGPATAPVTIVEFSDFQCPYCGQFTPVLRQVLVAYPTKVRLVYRYLPLTTIHPDAQKAAEAAVCAGNQGKFWEMHDTLFAEQSLLGVDALKEKSKRLGLDSKEFDACLDGGLAKTVVAGDIEAGERLGIAATPASFVNGRFVNGAVTFEQLSALIDDELHKAPATALR